ncbi:hypothetical protein [Pinibacter aurantiacus]|uniref:Outer membrane protein beta-barrel domain-containing protein n=1 Tax=Pinibacter aurantiacus TaxID=2851599 RepID=A0A9E2SER7_9BACT|nr:hypothetical protein [Pinibacter aurantiacus]MBV4359330.1 hypothetical protein [Pinibacter aurantiacus]
MKAYFFILAALLFCLANIQAQQKKKLYAERSKFMMSLEGGGLIPVHGFSIQDPFFKNSVNISDAGGFVIGRIAYFFSKKWGAEFEFLPWIAKSSDAGKAQQYLINQFTSKYYVTAPWPQNNIDAGVVSFMIGPTYKITTGRFMIMPKLLFGINSYDGMMNNYTLHLKEKQGNEIIDMTYNWNQDASTEIGWVFSPACTFSYRVTKILAVNMSVNYLYSPSVRLVYTTTEQNYKSQRQTTQEYIFETTFQSVAVGAGFSLLLK